MRSWGPSRRVLAGALAVAGAAVPLACGENGNGSGSGDQGAQGTTAPATVDFPKPSGRSFRNLLQNMRQGPVVAPSVAVLEPGQNRFGFALFDSGHRQIGALDVALYTARGVDETAHGPYRAQYNRIDVEPAFRSRTSSEDPDSAQSLYLAQVPFGRAGSYVVSAVTKLNGRLVAASPAQVRVGYARGIPGVGDRAVRVHTPTVESVGGDVSKIDTRVPPDSMHDVDLADALDEGRPVVLLFSSPALCESRVCGPVTDVAEEVKSEFGDDVDFIHMEFYEDNNPKRGVRPQVAAWGLTTEPWAFVIDAKGIVSARLQGAFDPDELRDAVRKALH